jgi:hypothetical protein
VEFNHKILEIVLISVALINEEQNFNTKVQAVGSTKDKVEKIGGSY